MTYLLPKSSTRDIPSESVQESLRVKLMLLFTLVAYFGHVPSKTSVSFEAVLRPNFCLFVDYGHLQNEKDAYIGYEWNVHENPRQAELCMV